MWRDSEFLHLGFERLPWDTEDRGSTLRTRDSPCGLAQCVLDHHLFSVGNIACQGSASRWWLWTDRAQPVRLDRDRVTITEDHSALNHVLQFAHVARPRIASEQ